MELIPTISKFILFILLALILVVAASYLFLKLFKKKDEENESSLEENRKHLREYIINQRKFVESSISVTSSHLNRKTYHGFTYQNNKTGTRKTKHSKGNSVAPTGKGKQRYIIVNKSKTTIPKSYTGSGFHQAEYSLFKTLHHEDD